VSAGSPSQWCMKSTALIVVLGAPLEESRVMGASNVV
jgi:hypothetical protein